MESRYVLIEERLRRAHIVVTPCAQRLVQCCERNRRPCVHPNHHLPDSEVQEKARLTAVGYTVCPGITDEERPLIRRQAKPPSGLAVTHRGKQRHERQRQLIGSYIEVIIAITPSAFYGHPCVLWRERIFPHAPILNRAEAASVILRKFDAAPANVDGDTCLYFSSQKLLNSRSYASLEAVSV